MALGLKIKAFITHKTGEEKKDIQDAFALHHDSKRYAISDGVGQSFFPDIWAKILVEEFKELDWPTPEEKERDSILTAWLNQAQNTWKQRIDERISNTENVKFFIRNKLANKESAAATFLGVSCWEENENTIKCRAIGLGDTFLFHFDTNGTLKSSFPTIENYIFDNFPEYLDSYPSREGKGEIRASSVIHLNEGDFLLLATDAFSALIQEYYLKTPEKILEWKNELDAITSFEEFNQLILGYRDKYHLHDDDTCILLLTCTEDAEYVIEYEEKLDSFSEDQEQSRPKEKPRPLSIEEAKKNRESQIEEPVDSEEDREEAPVEPEELSKEVSENVGEKPEETDKKINVQDTEDSKLNLEAESSSNSTLDNQHTNQVQQKHIAELESAIKGLIKRIDAKQKESYKVLDKLDKSKERIKELEKFKIQYYQILRKNQELEKENKRLADTLKNMVNSRNKTIIHRLLRKKSKKEDSSI